jgi:hypothetical protein
MGGRHCSHPSGAGCDCGVDFGSCIIDDTKVVAACCICKKISAGDRMDGLANGESSTLVMESLPIIPSCAVSITTGIAMDGGCLLDRDDDDDDDLIIRFPNDRLLVTADK